MRRWLLIAVAVVLVFAAQRECAADGCFLPPLSVKSPDMPQQRAIIVYRNGVERLIIESAFQGETGDYAWILPVPSEPLEIKKASNPLFKTVFYDLGKKVLDSQFSDMETFADISFLVFGLLFLSFILAILNSRMQAFTKWVALPFAGICGSAVVLGAWTIIPFIVAFLTFFFYRKRAPRTTATLTFVLALFVAVVYPFPLYGGHRGSSGPATPNVEELASQTIGDYDVTTLKAQNPDALDFWLTARGFQSLGPDGRRIAADYIAQKWCFVTGKMSKTDTRMSAPHPLEISFKTGAPVYPMRLTSLAGGPLYVDLIVIAEDAFECPPLQTEFTNSFQTENRDGIDGFKSVSLWKLTAFQGWSHTFSGTNWPRWKFVGHSKADLLLWDGCVVSKLSGTLTPAEMNEDIRPVKGENGKLMLLFTKRAAFHAGISAGISFLLILAVLFSVVLFFRKAALKITVFRGLWPFALVFGISAIAGLTFWLAAPTAEGREDPVNYSDRDPGRVFESALKSVCIVSGGPAEKLLAMYDIKTHEWPPMSDEMRSLLRQLSEEITPLLRKAGARNSLTGDPIAVEESPGNVIIELSDYNKSIMLSIYDVDGYSPRPWPAASYPPHRRE